jgi:regulator of replication initiation timing
MQNQEISGLHKRNKQLEDAVSKIEIQSYHVGEELREARSLTERLRNESANLQAENKFLRVRMSNVGLSGYCSSCVGVELRVTVAGGKPKLAQRENTSQGPHGQPSEYSG